MTLEETEKRLRETCGRMGVRYSLHWSEAENNFDADARGPGQGEFWEVKRAPTLQAAMGRLTLRLLAAGK